MVSLWSARMQYNSVRFCFSGTGGIPASIGQLVGLTRINLTGNKKLSASSDSSRIVDFDVGPTHQLITSIESVNQSERI